MRKYIFKHLCRHRKHHYAGIILSISLVRIRLAKTIYHNCHSDSMRGAPRTDCAVDAAMSVIEGRWKTVIICKLARNGAPMRFNQLINEIDGISPRIFTLQLKELENDGIIIRNVRSTSPKYVEYYLSEKGETLIPILAQLAEWGLKHMFPNMVSFEDSIVTEPDKADV